MRKVTASQPRSGAGNDEPSYKPTWPLFSDMSFLKDVIKPRKTQSNVSRKKFKSCEDTKIGDNPVNIVIPSFITRIPKNTKKVMYENSRDSQVIEIEESQIVEESQVVEESQIVEESQVVEKNQVVEESQVEEESQVAEKSQEAKENFYLWNAQFEDIFKKTNTATAKEFDDDVASIGHSSSRSASGSQPSIIPPLDNFYTKKKAAIEQVHGVIKSTAAKINSVCDTISVNLTQPEHTPSIEEDSALVLIKCFLKKVPSNMKVKCLSEIMAVLDKYSSKVLE
ncbi:uncharacterized protein LOC143908512 [Temnothorax americanus]|uniref:uncharacterized protein LOC143908512 n=1 Tax=Temnothorax americanus TaxID=1964332 RepID=UPI004068C0D4